MIQATQAEKNRAQSTNTTSATTAGPTRLYVGSLHFNITENDLRSVFDPFGDIEFINLHKEPESGRSKGFAFIQYRDANDAKKALQHCNGMELAGRQLKVGLVNESKTDAVGMLGELDDDGGGLVLNAQARALLMAKLANQRMQSPLESLGQMPSFSSVVSPLGTTTMTMGGGPVAGASTFQQPSTCLLLKNMFDPKTETDPDFDLDIKEDVAEECRKHGKPLHVHVMKDNPQGLVYTKMDSVEAAKKVMGALNHRWFAGKMIAVEFIPEETFKAVAGI